MKSERKKVSKIFRIAPELVRELARRKKVSGLTQTEILESALGYYFAGGMKRRLETIAGEIDSPSSSPPPSTAGTPSDSPSAAGPATGNGSKRKPPKRPRKP